MALTPEQIEKRKKAMLGDTEFIAKLQKRLANTKPEHEFGSYQHRELVALSVECREQVALREDFEALAAVAWELIKKLDSIVGFDGVVGPEGMDLYMILQDYYESEEDDEEVIVLDTASYAADAE